MSLDFRGALGDLADDSDVPFVSTPESTLALAQRRRQKRRLTVTGGVATAAAATVVAATVFLPPLFDGNGGSDRRTPIGPPTIQTPTTPKKTVEEGMYIPPQQISLGEQCEREIVAAGEDPSAEWISTLDPGNTLSQTLIVRSDGRGEAVTCRFPATARPRELPGPIATSEAGILDQCGQVVGYDFTGWAIVTSMAAAQGVEAVLASTNGYTAYCTLEPSGWDSGSYQEVRMPELSDSDLAREMRQHPFGNGYEFGLNGSSLSIKSAFTPIDGQLWYSSGTMYDGDGDLAVDAKRVVVTFRDTRDRVVIPVVNGRWAARIHLDSTAGLGQFDAVVEDESGRVLDRSASDR